jgi:glycosyltransferase involved in cell wall biosynthesis
MSSRGGQVLDVSVVIPTIGRPESLRLCLESLSRCDPRPAEVVVVEQNGGPEIAAVVGEFMNIGARRIASEPRGVGAARNLGLRAARYECVLITDDDCTVSDSWIREGWRFAGWHEYLITGSVLPGGDSADVVSTKVDPEPRDFTGELLCSVLYTGNMVAQRSELLRFGGFDEHLPNAIDNDLCYRWLRAGRGLRYEPSLRVWHNDTRTPAQIRRRYRQYWHGQGAFYGKHLRARDRQMLRFLAGNVRRYVRQTGAWALRRRQSPSRYRGFIRGVVPGLARGLLTMSDDS